MAADPRLIVLYPQSSTLRGRTITPTLPRWPPKDPTLALVHGVDFSLLLPVGATIKVARAIAVDDAVKLAETGKNDTVVGLQISGGTDGTVATVAIKLLLTNGDVLGASVLLPIVAQPGLSLMPVPGDTSGATVVTDEATGLPLADTASGLPLAL